jgi:hypothetical protein
MLFEGEPMMNGRHNNRLEEAQHIQRRIAGAADRTLSGLPELKEHIAAFTQEVQLAARQFSNDRAKEHQKENDAFYEYWIKEGLEHLADKER